MSDRKQFLRSLTLGATSSLLGGHISGDHSDAVEGYSYKIPDFKKGSTLLFQGDSITDMNRGREEWDRNHYLGHNYVYLIASRLGVELASLDLDFRNRGVSGHTSTDLRKRWQEDTLDLKPDLLSVLVGTNDIEFGLSAEQFFDNYRYMLDSSLEQNPELRVVLLEPFILQTGRLSNIEVWKKRRDKTDKFREVVRDFAYQYEAVLVKTQDIFDEASDKVSPEHWIWDGIHPLPQGHELIARNWIEEVSNRWPRK